MTDHYKNLILCAECDIVVHGEAIVIAGRVYHPDCLPAMKTYVVRRTEHAFADVDARSPEDAGARAKTLDPRDFSVCRHGRYSTGWAVVRAGEADIPATPPSPPEA